MIKLIDDPDVHAGSETIQLSNALADYLDADVQDRKDR